MNLALHEHDAILQSFIINLNITTPIIKTHRVVLHFSVSLSFLSVQMGFNSKQSKKKHFSKLWLAGNFTFVAKEKMFAHCGFLGYDKGIYRSHTVQILQGLCQMTQIAWQMRPAWTTEKLQSSVEINESRVVVDMSCIINTYVHFWKKEPG
jgi:hypothetical protein